jgi:cysteinyl-tRNA synthetase
MQNELKLYNTLSRKKEVFKPQDPPHVGMYVCGPTVYGYPHLGHAKSYVSFDIIYRWLKYLGYDVRYVQNITDVGHLTDDADEGEDKITRQSRLEEVEPMQVVEHYMYAYFRDMDMLNVLRADIAPRPSGHIPEQIKAIEELIEKGFAYEVNGSVYFDVPKYNEHHRYGKLSGRKVEDLLEGSANRELEGQSEKRSPLDFALWKRAQQGHIMKWDSPWGEGYPGWHIECTVMSQKYIGQTLDIHGGGNENIFPHHECEIAQGEALTEKTFAKYWMHNNMVTVNGQKMGKSLGNGISCQELFTGKHPLLEQAYSPMTVRFFILQSHYRSTLDFSNEALKAAEKGYKRLMNGLKTVSELQLDEGHVAQDEKEDKAILKLLDQCSEFMNDDFNTAMLLANLFELTSKINAYKNNQTPLQNISAETLQKMKTTFHDMVIDVLGLHEEKEDSGELDGVMQLLLELRQHARANKDWATSDKIREGLLKLGITVKDGKDGQSAWSLN